MTTTTPSTAGTTAREIAASSGREVFMVAFGGPEKGCCKHFDPCPGEAYCFVSGIFGHNADRKARIDEVTSHYVKLGGFSAFNDHTRKQAAALETELRRRGHPIRVRCGFHHWAPYARTVIAEATADHARELIVVIMAPHQSSVSWDHYLRIVGEGVQLAGDKAPRVAGVADPYWNKPGFITAIAERVRDAAENAGVKLNDPATAVLFSAHSIPAPLARTSPYVKQFEETAQLAAKELGIPAHSICFQSAPTDSGIQWTSPSVEATVAVLASAGKKNIIAAAIGFLCDNVEVIWDLGVEGENEAKKHGVRFVRAESVHDHPAFIGMLADQVEAKL
jgi:ferrochelatase